MAPIKFEEHIKDKLEQRTVTPALDAWSKLSQKLDEETSKTKKNRYWMFSAAASVVALIFTSVFYLTNNTETQISNTIVNDNTDKVKTIEAFKANATEENNIMQFIKKESQEKINPKKQQTTRIVNANKINKTDNVVQLQKDNEEFNSVVTELKNVKTKSKQIVTNQEVDSLLKLASQELLMEKTLKEKTNVVNADALLQDVEESMGQSFRTKVYQTLKEGYNKVKTRVAQRNN